MAESDRNRAAAVDANQATADAQQGKETQRRNRNETGSPLQLQISNSSKPCRIAKTCAPSCCNSSTLIFATRDTARGLIVNLSDVLFDTGKSTLRPEAREKLAKISGIVLAYPDLRLAIEGNTDSVGTDAMNQQLSEDELIPSAITSQKKTFRWRP